MKRLIELFERNRFRFTEQSRQKLGLEQDDIFTVWVKYGGPESRRGILVRNSRTEQKIEVPGDLEVVLELSLDSVRNIVDHVEISFYSTDLEKSLMGSFYLYLNPKENRLELKPKSPTISLNWNGYVQADGFPIPMLHLTRIAGVWVDLLMNIDRRIKAVEFLVPDMGQVSVTFNFRRGVRLAVCPESHH